MGAVKPISITVRISKEHLDVIDRELSRMHEILKDEKQSAKHSWAMDTIVRLQQQLLTLRDAASSAARSLDEP